MKFMKIIKKCILICDICCQMKVRKKAKIRNRYNQVPYGRYNQVPYGKVTKTQEKHHTQESQEFSPFPAGDHKAAKNIQDSMTKANTKHK